MLFYNICEAFCKYFHPSAPCFQPLFPIFQDNSARPQPKITPHHLTKSLHSDNKCFAFLGIYLILLGYKVFFTIIGYFSLKNAYFQVFFRIFSHSHLCRRRSFALFLARLKSTSQPVNLIYYHRKLKKSHFSELQDLKSPKISDFYPKSAPSEIFDSVTRW